MSLLAALEWLAGEASADRTEFQRAHPGQGEALLQGLISHGYVHESRGRFAVNDAGYRRMEAK